MTPREQIISRLTDEVMEHCGDMGEEVAIEAKTKMGWTQEHIDQLYDFEPLGPVWKSASERLTYEQWFIGRQMDLLRGLVVDVLKGI